MLFESKPETGSQPICDKCWKFDGADISSLFFLSFPLSFPLFLLVPFLKLNIDEDNVGDFGVMLAVMPLIVVGIAGVTGALGAGARDLFPATLLW